MTTTCTMILGDCLEVMPALGAGVSDLMICDLPYGMTTQKWDTRIDWSILWSNWAMAGNNPYTALCFANLPLLMHMIAVNNDLFRYELVWSKTRGSNPLVAKHRPVPSHEYIGVFSKKTPFYRPILVESQELPRIRNQYHSAVLFGPQRSPKQTTNVSSSMRHPLSVRVCGVDSLSRNGARLNANTQYHPTQKPLQLLRWLIRAYHPGGAAVLDPTAGSGSTALAAASEGMGAICIEVDENYHGLSVERLRKHIRDNLLDVRLEVRK